MSIVNFKPENIEFVSYTGKWPNLCSGVLTLRIHGEEHRFGYRSGMHPPFWTSGGGCGFPNGFNAEAVVSKGPWVIDADRLPSEFKSMAPEIDEVFNSNVPFGCCGGCI
jgi:hypothetical protein